MKKEAGGKRFVIWFSVAVAGMITLAVVSTMLSAPPKKTVQERKAEVNLGNTETSAAYMQAFQQQLTAHVDSQLLAARHAQDEALGKMAAAQQQQFAEEQAILTKELRAKEAAAPPPPRGESIDIHEPGAAPPDQGGVQGLSLFQNGPQAARNNESISYRMPEPPAKPAHIVPPNGFIRGTLLNGVVSTLGGKRQYALIRLDRQMISANDYRTNLSGCIVQVDALPNISAGRIEMKPDQLTCNLAGGKSRTWDVSGWVVGADGIQGVPGKIVNNLGKQVAAGAGAGAVTGIGQVINQSQYTNSTSANGTTSVFTGNPKLAALGGALGGAGSALQGNLKDYYALFAPSVEVGGGTNVTVVLHSKEDLPPAGNNLTVTTDADPSKTTR